MYIQVIPILKSDPLLQLIFQITIDNPSITMNNNNHQYKINKKKFNLFF